MILQVIISGIFEDDEVTHVEGEVNPVRDIEIIHEELRLKDVEYINKNVEQLERVVVRGGDKAHKMEYVSTCVCGYMWVQECAWAWTWCFLAAAEDCCLSCDDVINSNSQL